MEADVFEISILRQHWIKDDGTDDPEDLCSHGTVTVQIGKEVICDNHNVTTSAAALHLMRTTKLNYSPMDFAGQLLPCCGHFMTVADNGETLYIHGCPNGIDWTVKHFENGFVYLTTESGNHMIITTEEYKNTIFNFADEVEAFYAASSPKILPDDENDREAYKLFWNEWNNLRNSI